MENIQVQTGNFSRHMETEEDSNENTRNRKHRGIDKGFLYRFLSGFGKTKEGISEFKARQI